MLVTNHAIRRYKQRIGRRTASKRRIFTQIIKDLERDVQDHLNLPTSKHYILVTSKYKAVCYKNRVITIYLLDEAHEDFYEEELSAV